MEVNSKLTSSLFGVDGWRAKNKSEWMENIHIA